MTIVTTLMNGLQLRQERGAVSIGLVSAPLSYFTVGNEDDAKSIARAILAALGEPVVPKPDQSGLKKVSSVRWVAIDNRTGGLIHLGGWEDDIADVERVAGDSCAGEFRVYDIASHVGPRPEPSVRQVTRL